MAHRLVIDGNKATVYMPHVEHGFRYRVLGMLHTDNEFLIALQNPTTGVRSLYQVREQLPTAPGQKREYRATLQEWYTGEDYDH